LPRNLSQGIFGKQKFCRATFGNFNFVSEIQNKVAYFYAKDVICSFIEFLKHYPDGHFLIVEIVYINF